MAEEEFHEIQLNGKQLVFLFMTGTVAAVVIFLCGLMVGRNLRVPQLEAAAATTETVAVDPTADNLPAPIATASAGEPPATIKEDLRYAPLLEDEPTPAAERLEAARKPVEKPAAVSAPPAPAAKATTAPARASAFPEPPGNGWTVQVQAVNSADEAEALARRLNAKGYRPAFVTPSGSGRAQYRIRVGKFQKKQDAEELKARLERNEHFDPWVTR